MSMRDLQLAVALKMVDKLSGPAKKAGLVNRQLAKRLGATTDAMKRINQQAKKITALQGMNAQLGDSAKKLDAAQQNMKRLITQMRQAKKAGKATAALSKKINAANKSVKRLSVSHNLLRKKTGAARKELSKAGVDTRNLATAQQTLTNQTGKLNRKLERHKRLLTLSGKAGQSMRSGAAKARGMALWAGGAALAAGITVGMPMINTAAQFEGYESVLTTLEGSSAKAKASMNWISEFAASTPSQLGEVNEAFVRLRAYGLDPTNGLLKTLSDTGSAMNKPVIAAVEAIADAVTGENERLKEFGIKASADGDIFTYTYTDKKGRQQALSALKDDRKAIEQVLRRIWDEKYSGAGDRLSKTWLGIVSNLGDQWARFQVMVMESGPFEKLKGHLSGILLRLNEMAANGQLQEWAERAGSAFMQTIDALTTFGAKVWDVLQAVSSFAGGWENLAFAIAGMKLLPVIQSLGLLAKLAMAHPLLILISALAGGAYLIYKHWEPISAWFTRLLTRIKGTFAGGMASILESISGVIKVVPDWALPSSLEADQINQTIARYQKIARDSTIITATGNNKPLKPPGVAGAVAAGAVIQAPINVYPSPGMDEQALARAVGREVDLINNKNAARQRSQLIDEI